MFKIAIVAAVVFTVGVAVPAFGYTKGLEPYFGDKENEDQLAAYVQNIPDGCQLIFCPEHIYWTKLQQSVPEPDPHELATWFPGIIDEADRDVYLGINLLSDDRQGLYTDIPPNIPISPPGPFANSTVRTAFADECLEIVDHAWESSSGRVAYVALVLEMDYYQYNISQADYSNLIQAVIEARDTIKAEEDYADIPVGVYFNLNELWMRYSGGLTGIYTKIVTDEDLDAEMDFLGASVYPMGPSEIDLFEDPGDIDEDYFDLALNATALPFHIPELGWSSADVTFGQITVESSPDEQDDFVDLYFGLELNVPIVIWFVPHDIYSAEFLIPVKWPFATFKDMGLWEWDFANEKPAWGTWLNQ